MAIIPCFLLINMSVTWHLCFSYKKYAVHVHREREREQPFFPRTFIHPAAAWPPSPSIFIYQFSELRRPFPMAREERLSKEGWTVDGFRRERTANFHT